MMTKFTASKTTGVLAVYRMRDDGDADLIAAFDRQNCEGFFQNNNDGGADELARIVKDALEFDDREVRFVEFDDTSELVDVLDLTTMKEAGGK